MNQANHTVFPDWPFVVLHAESGQVQYMAPSAEPLWRLMQDEPPGPDTPAPDCASGGLLLRLRRADFGEAIKALPVLNHRDEAAEVLTLGRRTDACEYLELLLFHGPTLRGALAVGWSHLFEALARSRRETLASGEPCPG
ncbi:MAG: hypothetical protein ACFCVE_10570 [Phycisphaerae bacterium]